MHFNPLWDAMCFVYFFLYIMMPCWLVGWFGGWGGGHTVMSVVLYIWVDFVNEVAHCSPACLRGKIAWCLLLNLMCIIHC